MAKDEKKLTDQELRIAELEAQIEQMKKDAARTVSGPGVPADYKFKEYPKALYRPGQPVEDCKIVNDPDAEAAALADGWVLTPTYETHPQKK